MSKMKNRYGDLDKSKLNKSRRKAIPNYFKKRSNSSLSQLLTIGSYKKKVNNLIRNNRLLAIALQDARCEIAVQNEYLNEYAGNSNRIMQAHCKLKEMGRKISNLVTDYEEIVECLSIDWGSTQKDMLRNRSPKDKIKIKKPSLESIEENISFDQDDQLNPSNTNSVAVNGDTEESVMNENCENDEPSNESEVEECNFDVAFMSEPPVFLDALVPPPMFEEVKGKENKDPAQKESDCNQRSLTPELDLSSINYRPRRSSSRRLSQVFRRSTGSGGKVSNKDKDTSPKLSSESVKTSSTHINGGGSKLLSVTNDQSKNSPKQNFISAFGASVSKLPGTGFPSNDCPNETLILFEDMELTDVVSTANMCDFQNTAFDGSKAECVNKEISTAKTENKGKKLSKRKTHCNSKVPMESEMEFIANKEPEESKDRNLSPPELFQQPGFFATHDSDCEDPPKANKKIPRSSKRKSQQNTEEPPIKVCPTTPIKEPRSSSRSRTKNSVNYAVFFSPSDSDIEDSTKRVTAIYKPSTKQRSSEDSIEEVTHRMNKNLLSSSVFEFDSSPAVHNKNSKSKKSAPRSKKSAKTKEIVAKPLSQKCCVAKLSGVNFKFLRKNISEESVLPIDYPKAPEYDIPESTDSPDVHNEGNTNVILEDISQNKPDKELSEEKSLCKVKKNLNRLSESKRVSFASTDLVCKFDRVSITKTIASSAKVRRASKSIIGIPNPSKNEDSVMNGIVSEDNYITSENYGHIASNDIDLDEETEIYCVPSNCTQTVSNIPGFNNKNEMNNNAEVASTFPSKVSDRRKEKSKTVANDSRGDCVTRLSCQIASNDIGLDNQTKIHCVPSNCTQAVSDIPDFNNKNELNSNSEVTSTSSSKVSNGRKKKSKPCLENDSIDECHALLNYGQIASDGIGLDDQTEIYCVPRNFTQAVSDIPDFNNKIEMNNNAEVTSTLPSKVSDRRKKKSKPSIENDSIDDFHVLLNDSAGEQTLSKVLENLNILKEAKSNEANFTQHTEDSFTQHTPLNTESHLNPILDIDIAKENINLTHFRKDVITSNSSFPKSSPTNLLVSKTSNKTNCPALLSPSADLKKHSDTSQKSNYSTLTLPATDLKKHSSGEKKSTSSKKSKTKSNTSSAKKKELPTKPKNSNPVLKDVLNLNTYSAKSLEKDTVQEIVLPLELPRRRSKTVSYKEPSLNKKMRRE